MFIRYPLRSKMLTRSNIDFNVNKIAQSLSPRLFTLNKMNPPPPFAKPAAPNKRCKSQAIVDKQSPRWLYLLQFFVLKFVTDRISIRPVLLVNLLFRLGRFFFFSFHFTYVNLRASGGQWSIVKRLTTHRL